MKLLLERGGNVDTATYKGITPLQVSSPTSKISSRCSIVKLTGGFKEGLYFPGEAAAWLGCCSRQGMYIQFPLLGIVDFLAFVLNFDLARCGVPPLPQLVETFTHQKLTLHLQATGTTRPLHPLSTLLTLKGPWQTSWMWNWRLPQVALLLLVSVAREGS